MFKQSYVHVCRVQYMQYMQYMQELAPVQAHVEDKGRHQMLCSLLQSLKTGSLTNQKLIVSISLAGQRASEIYLCPPQ